MKAFAAGLLVGVLILLGCRLVAAESPQQSSSDHTGTITGYVLDVTGRPHDWAIVYAKNSQHAYEAFTGYSGEYLMRVPVGVYNVSVNAPTYNASPVKLVANGSTANVTENGTVRIDFHLQEIPIPEFPSSDIPLAMALVFGSAFFLRRHLSKR